MTTSIQGTRLALTPEIRRHVESTLDSALRSLGGRESPAVHAAVEVEHTPRGQYRAGITLTVGLSTLRAEAAADSLRQALRGAHDPLTRQVQKWRARRRDARRRAGHFSAGLNGEA